MNSADKALVQAVRKRERRALAKAITLIESTRPDHRRRADAVLAELLPYTGKAVRVGISGVPGVGKSTFIEALGLYLVDKQKSIAVLTVDPSSSISGGSILGDKTRMEKLSVDASAFIRPSPASGTLGGVAEKTREAMLVCEAAGYDVVVIETIGIGQSEVAVAGMTDMFVLMHLPNAGDGLQAIKRGVMELADLIVVNKADLDPDAARRAAAEIASAQRLLSLHHNPEQNHDGTYARVLTASALLGQGLEPFWASVEQFCSHRQANGEFIARRRRQSLAWMWEIVYARLRADFHQHPAVRKTLARTMLEVSESRMVPSAAARALLDLFECTAR